MIIFENPSGVLLLVYYSRYITPGILLLQPVIDICWHHLAARPLDHVVFGIPVFVQLKEKMPDLVCDDLELSLDAVLSEAIAPGFALLELFLELGAP
jgi:hypothetical protein